MFVTPHLPQVSNLGKMNLRPDRAIGDFIKDAREAAGLSQDELARKAGISPATISHWERPVDRKRPSLFNLEKVCKVLGVSVPDAFARGAQNYVAATPEERELLELYRRLSPKKQGAVLAELRIIGNVKQ